jgi:AraC-like DNA-binding protein/quercetin dioxygenase-like cupin family protein
MSPTSAQVFPLNIRTEKKERAPFFSVKPITPDKTIPIDPHRHDHYEVIFISTGKGNCYIDFQLTPIHPPCLHLVAPWQIHHWAPDCTVEGFVLSFYDEFLSTGDADMEHLYHLDLFNRTERKDWLELSKNQNETVDKLFQSILDETSLGEKCQSSILKAYLHILMENIHRWSPLPTTSSRSMHPSGNLVHRFYHLVTQQALECREVRVYAKKLNVSHTYLSDLVKATTNKTPGELIRNYVVMEAKRLLMYTECSIKEICYRLQFEDPSYFGRFFRRETGISPGQYRTQTRKKHQFSEKLSLFPDEFS